MKKDNRSSFSFWTMWNLFFRFESEKIRMESKKRKWEKITNNFSLCKFNCSMVQNNRLIKVLVQTYARYIWKEREQWWWRPKKDAKIGIINKRKCIYYIVQWHCSVVVVLFSLQFSFSFASEKSDRKQKQQTTTERWVCLILNNF